jgi:hypothetical protein
VKTLARRRDRDEILARLRTVRADSQRRWGRMSAHQMICHLSDAFLMVQGRKPVSDRSSVLQRTVVKWIALYAPLRWPSGILTSAEIDQEVGGTRPADFAADVAQVERLVELVTTRTTATEWEPHPIFGRLSASAWLRWAYLHMDHHLRQFGA